ncbi:MAG: acyloxyacyl hydrolase [Prevotella sp.]|uniref:acyloxyacyl hydrolase n=1 Tax=Prevotella sp. 20925_1_30 TaxID=3003679 RepID=UPI001CAC1E4F|nr:acyloxyacyl hydrolase [Prevotella sp.]
MRTAILILLSTLSINVTAEVNDSLSIAKMGIEFRYIPAQTLTLDKEPRIWTKTKDTHSWAAQINVTPTKNAYAHDYNYPTFSFGLRYHLNHGTTMHRDDPWGEAQPVNYTSKLGNFLTLYGTFNRPLYRSKHWQWGYYLGTGIAYTSLKYNQKNDIDNEYIGSHLNIYFNAGLYGQVKIAKEWSVKGGLDFAHHSNGAMARPNKGANYFGPFVGLVYEPQQATSPIAKRNTEATQPFQKYWFTEFTLGLGGKTLLEEWLQTQFNTPQGQPDYRKEHFTYYGAYSFHTHLLYRYARRWASGVGVGLFYGEYAHRIARMDKENGHTDEKHSPWSASIEARHEVYYGNVSVRLTLGYYLYRHMGYSANHGLEYPYHEQVGVFYSFPKLKGLTLGFSVNAHATKADFTELQLSIPVRL